MLHAVGRTVSGVPQDSILEPLFFDIYIYTSEIFNVAASDIINNVLHYIAKYSNQENHGDTLQRELMVQLEGERLQFSTCVKNLVLHGYSLKILRIHKTVFTKDLS